MTTTTTGASIDRRLLGIWLNDHLGGGTAGLSLARRARAGTRSPDLASALDAVTPRIAEDRVALRDLMRRLGVPARGYKVAAGRAGELVGRLKPNGRVRGRSPLSDLVELEGLVMGITGKESLWRSLRALADDVPELDADGLDRLIARAESQRETLEGVRASVTRRALAPEAPPPASP
jgi:hypothetical protein